MLLKIRCFSVTTHALIWVVLKQKIIYSSEVENYLFRMFKVKIWSFDEKNCSLSLKEKKKIH